MDMRQNFGYAALSMRDWALSFAVPAHLSFEMVHFPDLLKTIRIHFSEWYGDISSFCSITARSMVGLSRYFFAQKHFFSTQNEVVE